jgi:hypothetical protein
LRFLFEDLREFTDISKMGFCEVNNLIRSPDNVDKPLPGCYNYGRKYNTEMR